MTYEFKLPDIGEGVHEGEIVAWLVAEGDTVDEDQDIVEVMTDKATVQISSPVSGTIASIRAQAGDVINVGDIFVVIEEADGASSSTKAKPTTSKRAARAPKQVDAPTSPAGNGAMGAPQRTPTGVLAPPSVRREARRHGVDLTQVEGTARGGRITAADLAAWLARPSEAEATTSAPEPADEPARGPEPRRPEAASSLPTVPRDDILGVEPVAAGPTSPRASAARAKRHQAHFTYVLELDASALARVAEPTALAVKAIATALSEHPRCAALVDESNGELVVAGRPNVAVAHPTDDGLLLVTVRDPASLTVTEIAAMLARGGDGDAPAHVTLTALEGLGGVVATPVLIHPQVTGLHLGKVREVAQLDGGQVTIGHVATLSSTFDHRYIDGYDGALFAARVAELIASGGT